MSPQAKVQYTVRAIPRSVDRRLRQLAKDSKKSLNQIAVEALARAAGVTEGGEPVARREVDHLVDSWEPEPEALAALAAMRAVDPKLWR